MTKTTKRLFDAFDRSAKAHGWEADQGSPPTAEKAKERYERAKAALVTHIEAIENHAGAKTWET